MDPVTLSLALLLAAPLGPSRGGERLLPDGSRGRSHAVQDSIPGVPLSCPDFLGGSALTVQGQHVTSDGELDLAWSPSDGVCIGTTDDVALSTAPDASGGLFVLWSDRRGEDADVRALRLDSDGDVEDGWPSSGVLVCAHPGDQDQLSVCSDGAGGVLVAWQDYRAGGVAQVFAQRLNSAGASAWAAGGLAIEADTSDQSEPAICSDGAGGALVVWQTGSGGGASIRAATVTSGGTVTVRGPPVLGGTEGQRNPQLVADDEYGAYLLWEQVGESSQELRLLRVDLAGSVWSGWTSSGLSLAISGHEPILGVIAIDDSGTALVAWCDRDSGSGDIRAQRVSRSGVPSWQSGGAPVCVQPHDQYAPAIVNTPGGVVIAWEDHRRGRADIRAQKLDAEGTSLWDSTGVELCRLPGDQSDVVLRADSTGGAYALWRDAATNARAQFTSATPAPTGPVPVLVSTEVRPGNVKFTLSSQPDDPRPVRLARMSADGGWADIAVVRADAQGRVIAQDRTVSPGTHASYLLTLEVDGGTIQLRQLGVDVPMPMPLGLRFSLAEEGGRVLRMAVTLASEDEATIEVMDPQGRRVLRKRFAGLGAGEHDLRVPFGGAPGMYFVRLHQGIESRTGRLVVIR